MLVKVTVFLGCTLAAAAAQAQSRVCSAAAQTGQIPQLRQVLVLRPTVKLMKDTHKDAGGASEQAEAGFQGALARAFEGKGYKMAMDPVLVPDWEQNPATAVIVKKLKDDFASLLPETLDGSPDCATLLTVSLKANMNFSENDKFDALVLATGRGYLVNKSGKLRDVLSGLAGSVPPGDDLYMNIAVLDRGTGKILLYCHSTASGPYVDAPDRRLSGPISECLEGFPEATAHKTQ